MRRQKIINRRQTRKDIGTAITFLIVSTAVLLSIADELIYLFGLAAR